MENNQSTQPPPPPSVSKIERFLMGSFPNFGKFFIIGLAFISSGKYVKLYFRNIFSMTIFLIFCLEFFSSECHFWQKCPSQSHNLEDITLHYTTIQYSTLNCTAHTTVHYTAPHHTTVHYTTLHHTTLQYTTLHRTALHHTTLHYIILYYTSGTRGNFHGTRS